MPAFRAPHLMINHHPAGRRATRWEGERLYLTVMLLELAMGFTALACGGLLIVNGLGMPQSALEHSPFESFLFPGLLLGGIVGGSMLLAARLLWFRHPLAPIASLIAGFILLGWIVGEAVMIRDGRSLQLVIATYALVTITISWRLLRRRTATPSPHAT